MDPAQVRFSQNTIRFRFRDGTTIEEMAESLRSGELLPDEVTPLRLVERDGCYYTLDNRRLEAFRRAGVSIPWRMATLEEIENECWKFTTTNDGTSVQVRGENR